MEWIRLVVVVFFAIVVLFCQISFGGGIVETSICVVGMPSVFHNLVDIGECLIYSKLGQRVRNHGFTVNFEQGLRREYEKTLFSQSVCRLPVGFRCDLQMTCYCMPSRLDSKVRKYMFFRT